MLPVSPVKVYSVLNAVYGHCNAEMHFVVFVCPIEKIRAGCNLYRYVLIARNFFGKVDFCCFTRLSVPLELAVS